MRLDEPLTFDFDATQSSYQCVLPIHAKVFSIQMFHHFSQIAPRVCTLGFSLFTEVRTCIYLSHIKGTVIKKMCMGFGGTSCRVLMALVYYSTVLMLVDHYDGRASVLACIFSLCAVD